MEHEQLWRLLFRLLLCLLGTLPPSHKELNVRCSAEQLGSGSAWAASLWGTEGRGGSDRRAPPPRLAVCRQRRPYLKQRLLVYVGPPVWVALVMCGEAVLKVTAGFLWRGNGRVLVSRASETCWRVSHSLNHRKHVYFSSLSVVFTCQTVASPSVCSNSINVYLDKEKTDCTLLSQGTARRLRSVRLLLFRQTFFLRPNLVIACTLSSFKLSLCGV